MLWGITFKFGSRARLLLMLSVIPSDIYSASGSLLRISSGRTAIESIWPDFEILQYMPSPAEPITSRLTQAAIASLCFLIPKTLDSPLVEAPSNARLSSVAVWKRPSGDFDRHLST